MRVERFFETFYITRIYSRVTCTDIIELLQTIPTQTQTIFFLVIMFQVCFKHDRFHTVFTIDNNQKCFKESKQHIKTINKSNDAKN